MLVLRTDHGLGSTSGAFFSNWLDTPGIQGNSLLETITSVEILSQQTITMQCGSVLKSVKHKWPTHLAVVLKTTHRGFVESSTRQFPKISSLDFAKMK